MKIYFAVMKDRIYLMKMKFIKNFEAKEDEIDYKI